MNNKIISEWNKIKDYKIFDSINEFAILFDEKPNGSCYKKYSNYDWSKENFFFGNYEDLLTFYKTSTEIPFYLNDNIGKKFGQLTIQSFNVRVQNNKRKYFAICSCDCGNTCEKEYSRIISGHVSTCGKHKQEHKNDLLSNYKDITEKYWDYDKNDDLPENVNIKSEKEYWWKDETGSFKLKPTELTKRKFGTSFHEQSIYFYLKQLFSNVKNRYRLRINDSSSEADIFIQDYNVAIEYDGVFWHKEKYQEDLEKSKRFNSNGIILIRVREKGLLPIDLKLTKTIYCNFNDIDFHKTIKQIILYIKDTCNLSEEILLKISNFKLTETRFKEDKVKILDQYRTNYIENNITKTCLIKYWNYEKNNIIPQKVSLQDDIDVWFKCPYGFNKEINVKQLSKDSKLSCNNSLNCLKCNSFYCPFVSRCETTNTYYADTLCPSMKKYFYYNIIERKIPLKNFSYLTENCIGAILPKTNDDFYSLTNIYLENKNLLEDNPQICLDITRIFRYAQLNTSKFKTLSDLSKFLYLCNPIINKVIYEDFDVDDEHRQFLIKCLANCKITDYNWESALTKVSNKFYQQIKRVMEQRFIDLNTKNKTLKEIKLLIKKYNPKCINIDFKDFDVDTNHRNFILSYFKKYLYLENINDIPFDRYNDLSAELLKKIPLCYNKPNKFLVDFGQKKWNDNYYILFKDKMKVDKIELNIKNYTEYLNFIWKQHKKFSSFAIEFTQKNNNHYIEIEKITLKSKNYDKTIKLKVNNSRYWHTEFLLKENKVKCEESPFFLEGITGYVIKY